MPVVSKITLSGFDYTEIEVDKAILANGISFTIAFSEEVKDLGKMVGPRSVNFSMEKFS